MLYENNTYLHLTTYPEIYQELIYQRNEAISQLEQRGLLTRNRIVSKDDRKEQQRHETAAVYRSIFRENILLLFDRLYSHDAIEATYDFNAIELGNWSDTEANRLERELQQLQMIIGKLETRYELQYRITFEYDSGQSTLYMNRNKVFACGQSTLKHRLLTTLFSKPTKLWGIDDIDKYFAKNFGFVRGELKDRSIEKTGNDIKAQVAMKTGVRDFLIVTNSSARVNSVYLA